MTKWQVYKFSLHRTCRCCCCCCKVASVMSDSVQSHRWQPTRIPHPWDSPGKNTGLGCHFLLQCMKMKNESEATQSCLTLALGDSIKVTEILFQNRHRYSQPIAVYDIYSPFWLFLFSFLLPLPFTHPSFLFFG